MATAPLSGTIIERLVGETGRPLQLILGSEDGTLPASLPEGSTITLTATRVDTGQAVFTGHTVTVVDWATLTVSVPLAPSDVAIACTMRLVFQAIPLGGAVPDDVVEIPDAKRYALYLQINPV